MYNIDYLSYLILGIMLGVFTIIVIQVKKYYYHVSEKKYADKMQEYLFKVQNGLNEPDLLEIKRKMKDLDENRKTSHMADSAQLDKEASAYITPTEIVKQVNMKISSGVSKVKDLSGDVYEEYVKPVVYKIRKTIGW